MSKTKDQAINDRNRSIETESVRNVMLRIDSRTYILVRPEKATPEYAEEVRKRFEGYNKPGKKGGSRKK